MIDDLLWVLRNSFSLACLYFLFLFIWFPVFYGHDELRDAALAEAKHLSVFKEGLVRCKECHEISDWGPLDHQGRENLKKLKEQIKKRAKTDFASNAGLFGIGVALSTWLVSNIQWMSP